jgi:hypothetical protein
MPYILVMLFLTTTPNSQYVNHVDSIRFDTQEACEAAQKAIGENTKLDTGGHLVTLMCMAAK